MKLMLLGDAGNRHVLRWADYFGERGHQVHLLSLEKAGPTRAEVHQLKAPPLPRPLRYLSVLPQVRRLAGSLRPDLVNAHFLPNYGWVSALAGLSPLAVSIWGSDILISAQKSPLHLWRARYVLSRCRAVTCDGDNLFGALQELGVEPGRILNVPMGIEEDIIAFRKNSWSPDKKILITSIRQLEPVYDVATLIRALPLLGSEISRISLAVAGTGSQAAALAGLSRQTNVAGAVDFLSSLGHEEVIGLLQKTDIYVSTSISDSTSVSLLEAMACGCVPVVTDIPGNREWVTDGENGYLFPAGDHDFLARLLKGLISRPPDAKAISRRNALIIGRKGLWKNNMAMIEKRFAGIAGDK